MDTLKITQILWWWHRTDDFSEKYTFSNGL